MAERRKNNRIKDGFSCSPPGKSPIRTGDWRSFVPTIGGTCSPCTKRCPCASNIAVWLKLVFEGKFSEAWRVLTAENPFPLVCGFTCYRFCEKKCNRLDFDNTVSINDIELFLGRYAAQHNLYAEMVGDSAHAKYKVAVIGAGPAGLAAAHFLAKEGVSVTIYDEHKELGGMLRVGIPEYRLPKHLLRSEMVRMVLALGVKTKLGKKVDASAFLRIKADHDFVLVALGAHKSKNMSGLKMESALRVLREINAGKMKRFSYRRDVFVVGGGNTAIDAARSLRRLGATVTVLYRRTEDEMPAHKDEVATAKKEGVAFRFLVQPIAVQKRGAKITVRCKSMKLGGPDESGRRRPVEDPGKEVDLVGHMAYSAIGEETDFSLLGGLSVSFGQSGEVLHGNVLCAGDALYGPKSVSEAIASGKEAANVILDRLLGRSHKSAILREVTPQDIKFKYLKKKCRQIATVRECALTEEEFKNFASVRNVISETEAKEEAARCINCGTCTGCDRCFDLCPDVSMMKREDGTLWVNLEWCKGCNLCQDVCPRGVIGSKEEEESHE